MANEFEAARQHRTVYSRPGACGVAPTPLTQLAGLTLREAFTRPRGRSSAHPATSRR